MASGRYELLKHSMCVLLRFRIRAPASQWYALNHSRETKQQKFKIRAPTSSTFNECFSGAGKNESQMQRFSDGPLKSVPPLFSSGSLKLKNAEQPLSPLLLSWSANRPCRGSPVPMGSSRVDKRPRANPQGTDAQQSTLRRAFQSDAWLSAAPDLTRSASSPAKQPSDELVCPESLSSASPPRPGPAIETADDYWNLLTKGTGLEVKVCGGAGRGVFTTRHLAAGEVIHWAVPVVAHPALECLDKVCYNCLCHLASPHSLGLFDPHQGNVAAQECGQPPADTRCHEDGGAREASTSQGEPQKDAKRLDLGGGFPLVEEEAGAPRLPPALFCSSDCRDMAEAQFYGVERSADWGGLMAYCRQEGVRFALVARRLACMVLAGAAAPLVLRPLCFVRVSGPIPDQWLHEYSLIRDALERSGLLAQRLEFLTAEWYAGVASRLHLNAFKVAMPLPPSGTSLLEAAAAAVDGDGAVGTAVFLLASFYNHDCDPNVDIWWPCDAAAQLRARRDILPGEEVRITYLDTSMERAARQELLREAYGFQCRCQRCRDEED